MTNTNVEQFLVKKLIKSLNEASGSGTSMISIVIRPGEDISGVNKKLTEEYGKASRIKSRVNRLSVQSAISSTQQKLKGLYGQPLPNGLVIYVGTIKIDETKEKMISRIIVPFRQINTSLYLCDSKFHTEFLSELLENDDKFGFIIIDGSGAIFGTLCGNTKETLRNISVDLPKKHGRGGQSSVRFARLRLEARHNYLRRVSEMATQIYITDNRPNVVGIIIAGLADFKNELNDSDMFDPRLKRVVIKIVDVAYGGDAGFNQAIELSSEELHNVKFVQEKKLIARFMEEVSMDSMKFAFGIEDTMKALEMGATQTLIIWENLDLLRYETKTKGVIFSKSKDLEEDIIECVPAVEWFAENYNKFGTQLEFITDKSQEGSQFCKGFGGIGCLLRYKVDFLSLSDPEDQTPHTCDDPESIV